MKNYYHPFLRKILVLSFFTTLLMPDFVFGQKSSLESAIDHIPALNRPLHKVLVLGSPHFDLGQNASDWKPEKEMDMMTPEKQKEIIELVNMLAKFKPTRICIEWEPRLDSLWNTQYQLYRKDQFKLRANETYQIAFRLGTMLGLDSLYCIDNRPKQSESLLEIEDWDKYVAENTRNSDLKTYDSLNHVLNRYADSVKYTLSLKDYYLLVNNDAMKRQNKRLWFTGMVHIGNKTTYVGADLTGTWYQRNTRIFSNVKKLCNEQEERILILYGYSHAFILEEMFVASQQFEVVPVSAVLK